MQNGGHLQSNTSISETKRRRTFNFDSMSRCCGACISEKVLLNTQCHCIHHFGGDLKNMAAISKVVGLRLSQKLRDFGAFKLDSMSRFCGAQTCRRSIVSYMSVLGINHFDDYGGHFTNWHPFP